VEAVTVTRWVISRKGAFLKIHQRLKYYQRVFPAYLGPKKSQLSFWHETPAVNERCQPKELGEYYMPFTEKADYRGQYDSAGIPLLDYHGKLGLQYKLPLLSMVSATITCSSVLKIPSGGGSFLL
jgi:hypothetical protein